MAVIPSSSNYCGYCGNRLQATKTETMICDRCGVRIPASAKFCPNCGEDLKNTKESKIRMRFAWLKDAERRYASDYTRFRAVGMPNAEDENEGPVFDKAKKKAKDTNEPVMVCVILFEKRGEIDSFPWASIKPDGTIDYIYT
jgi:ribosomal protein L40E